MPIYEYTCPKCGKSFDKLVRSMSSVDAVACPACGTNETARNPSRFAVASTSSAPVPSGYCPCGKNAGGCGG